MALMPCSEGQERHPGAPPSDQGQDKGDGASLYTIERPDITYWRTATGEEVDFVIERRGELVGVEVKATARPRLADAAHLRAFRDEYGASVRGCLLVHGGETTERIAPGIVSVPWWRVL